MEYCGTLILTILAGVLWAFHFLYRNVNHFKWRGIPYVKAIPLIGSMERILLRKECFAETVHRLYNMRPDLKYVGIHEFLTPVVMLRDPELIKSVAIKNFDSFVNRKNFLDEKLDPLFSTNLFFLEDERWRGVRSLLSPAFTSSKMKSMFKLMSQCGIDLADYLTAQASTPVEIELKEIFTRYTTDVVATSAFGISVNSLKDRENDFYIMGKRATTFRGIRNLKVFLMKISPFIAKSLGLRAIDEDINDFFKHIIGSTISMRDEKGIVRNDMIQLMMQSRDKVNLTTQDMTAQAFIFFFGGFDTSSTLMCFAAHEVGVNPEVQEKLQAEIDAVLAECDGEVTYEALHGMGYLDAVLNEALRLYPPFPVMDRVCSRSFELPPAGPGLPPFTLRAGEAVWFPCHGIHRDPQYFPDPDKFDPERFSEENKGSIPPSAYFPFGNGPRSCIGNRFALMEAKLALFHMFAKCKLSPCSRTSIPMKLDPKNFNINAKNGFWMTIEKRF